MTKEKSTLSSIKPPKNLPPERTATWKLMRQKEAVEAEIAKLEHGRRGVADIIAGLANDAIAAQERRRGAALGLIDRIKKGAGRSLAAPEAAVDRSEEMAVAREALGQLDVEIADLRQKVEQIDEAIAGAVKGALDVRHDALIDQYESALAEMRQTIAEIVSLERVMGRSPERVVFDAPHFGFGPNVQPVRIDENHVSKCVAEWRKLADALHNNPERVPELSFPKHDPEATEQLIYHEMSQSERALVDARRLA